MPTFQEQDDLVFQVDFNNFDAGGKYLKGSMYHGLSRRIPRRMERVFLKDGEGNRCWAWVVHDVKGVKLLFELDETTWVSGELDVVAASPAPTVVGTLTR